MTKLQLKKWISQREKKDQKLYQKYGKPLEKKHEGKYLAINDKGKIILGKNDVQVLKQAIEEFGGGNFALKRVGHQTFGQWLKTKE